MIRCLRCAVALLFCVWAGIAPAQEDGGLDPRWTAAQEHLAANEPRAALPYLEDLVSQAPGIAAFRLDLALALFLTEDDTRARFHFDQALGGDLTEAERRTVGRFLDRLDRRKDWEVQFRFTLLPETNPTRRTAAETIDIGGLQFVLDPVEDDGAATALLLGGGLDWTPTLARDLKARLSARLDGRLYEAETRNDVAARIETGLLALADGGRQVGAGLSYQRRYLDGEAFAEGPGAYLTYQQRLTDRMQLGARLDHARLSHPDLPQRDGTRSTADLRLAYVLTPQMSVSGGVVLTRSSAQAAWESGTDHALSLGLQYLFNGGLITALDLRQSTNTRDDRAPLFLDPREDRRISVTTGLRHRNFTLGGFAPTLELGHERQESNISLYEYENSYIAIGLSRVF